MCIKYVESNIPEGFELHVHHYHSGNSSRRFRHGKEYMTEAWITRQDDNVPLATGIAYCCKNDNPRRSVGRAVAVGRAMEHLIDREGHPYSPNFGEA